LTFTGSVNVIETLEYGAAESPSAGTVLATAGAASPLFRGFGVPLAKAAALSSVSCAPPLLRRSAVVLRRPGAAAEPSKQLAMPYPTKSTIVAPVGHG